MNGLWRWGWVGVLALALGLGAAEGRRFGWREPEPRVVEVAMAPGVVEARTVAGVREDGVRRVYGSLVVVGVEAPGRVADFLRREGWRAEFFIGERMAVVAAPSAWAAMELAERWSQRAEVRVACPEEYRPLRREGPYAAAPNDPLFGQQWHLENRATNGLALGADLNVRAAWPWGRGRGQIIGIADGGIDLEHRDLTNQQAAGLHYNFDTLQTNGWPSMANDAHGTWVAGLAVAQAGNRRGVAGVAPEAQFASWVILTPNGNFVSSARLAEMFQHRIQRVGIQNHSWNESNEIRQTRPTEAERQALEVALSEGRGGRGVIMCRPSGNARTYLRLATDDGYLNDPRVLTVGAVRADGRVAGYSCLGTCVLLAMPNGTGLYWHGVWSTDLSGAAGWSTNAAGWPENDASDYTGDLAGTSFSVPQMAGLAALLLSVNTNLTIRDVQQILALAAGHYDGADPALKTNGAGLRVSVNVGFGVPDAGQAVRLAQGWSNRPPAMQVSVVRTQAVAIPENALRLEVYPNGAKTPWFAFSVEPNRFGPRADRPTAVLPLRALNSAEEMSATNAGGSYVLLPVAGTNYEAVIQAAAGAGARGVIFYLTNSGPPTALAVSDFCPLPAALLAQTNGLLLRGWLATNAGAQARLKLEAAAMDLTVTNGLVCEWVGLRVKTTHPRRGDLRITLQSPAGTVSELQMRNTDTSAGPSDWTYYTCHHYLEAGAGLWRAQVSDEVSGATGMWTYAELVLQGVGIRDANQNGLDDDWEQAWLHTTQGHARGDPDGDGYNNAVEQVLGTDPLAPNHPLVMDISPFNAQYLRLSWPAGGGEGFEVWTAGTVSGVFSNAAVVPGRFPETEAFVPRVEGSRFFRLRQ
ncbi:S8 family serine peptidase [Fontisphaera persica]|uniref:S8 family serine peptidase n=1 Tax=Fontisphaera persica TaxID=2974023 RepID=UPI0024BF4E84|nr:S8 family serine peptidase [Fontisphaera persica]WCJ58855.1 S8 family serine peptidase [Fontisphaera persica]